MKPMLHTPEGVRDVYGRECQNKLHIEEKIHTVFASYGYEDIQTPTFEFFDIFSREVGTIPSRDLYKFFDREGNTLVLRPDFTPSVARAYSKYVEDETMPARFCYGGNGFINESGDYRGRLKETTQMGVEMIGDGAADADGEIIALAVESMLRSGLTKFQVEIGQVDFFKGLVEEAGLSDDVAFDLREMISSKNYFGADQILEDAHVAKERREVFLHLTEAFGTIEKMREAKSWTSSPRALAAIDRLEQLYDLLKLYGYEDYVTFDLGMLSKYRYYTGIIFQVYTYGQGTAVAKGGRYDNLLNYFGRHAAAVGMVVMLDQLMSALARQDAEPVIERKTILVLYEAEGQRAAFEKASELREQHIPVILQKRRADVTLGSYRAYMDAHGIARGLYVDRSERLSLL